MNETTSNRVEVHFAFKIAHERFNDRTMVVGVLGAQAFDAACFHRSVLGLVGGNSFSFHLYIQQAHIIIYRTGTKSMPETYLETLGHGLT